jgi:hypothetical protein
MTTASRLDLGPTQPPKQWVTGALSLGVKQPRREADHSPPSSAEVKEWVELYLHSPNTPSLHGAQAKISTGTTLPYLCLLLCCYPVFDKHMVKITVTTDRITFLFQPISYKNWFSLFHFYTKLKVSMCYCVGACPHCMTRSRILNGGDGPRMWGVAANILKKLSRTADMGWSSNLGGWQRS